MEYKLQKSRIYWLFIAILLFLEASSAWGVILHPEGEPNLADWTDRPYDYAVGRWGTNCSCVAVSRNCVISVQHSGTAVVDIVLTEVYIRQSKYGTIPLRICDWRNWQMPI